LREESFTKVSRLQWGNATKQDNKGQLLQGQPLQD
jgi:hypothetical protein